MNLLQLDKTMAQFLSEHTGETIPFNVFHELYYPTYEQVAHYFYLHLQDGVCKIPVEKDMVYVSKIVLLTDEDVSAFANIIEQYEAFIKLGKYILKEHNTSFDIQPAPITIKEFERQMEDASDDNDQFTFDDIDFYPGESSYYPPDFEVGGSSIDACFIRLKDGWVSVPIAEQYTYGTSYECYCKVLTKDNIQSLEEELEESIADHCIEQHELKAMRYMIDTIKNQ